VYHQALPFFAIQELWDSVTHNNKVLILVVITIAVREPYSFKTRDETMPLELSVDGEINPGQETVGCDDGVDPANAMLAGEAAFARVMEFKANSSLMRNPGEDNNEVTRLDWSDVVVEGMIGVGGFACVCKVSVPVLELEDNPANGDDDGHSSHTGTSTSSAGAGLYALKCLNQRTTMNQKMFISGAADLASEFLLLSHLRHTNIVRLYGVANGCVSQAFKESGGYFLLLELLRGTVSDLLRLWSEDLKTPAKAMKIPTALERLQGIALGIAKGMEYLHQNNIVFRDLKPHNVGFDREGNVRLFDFGLAREVVANSTTTDVSIPGVAGSFRYMAPEVAVGKGAVFGSDVFSYGMLLWQILTLQKPFEKLETSIDFKERVAVCGERPTTKTIATFELTELLRKCWDEDPQARPSFTDVCKVLEMDICNHGEALGVPLLKMPTWRQQLKFLKKSMQQQLRERRNSAN
jgi:serine/threonine protein kinase